MTLYIFVKNITCTDSLDCSNRIVSTLESAFSCKLHPQTATENGLHGGTHIIHIRGAHVIEIQFYDRDFVFVGRQLRKLATIPTRQRVINSL